MDKFRIEIFFSNPEHSIIDCIDADNELAVEEVCRAYEFNYEKKLEFYKSRNVFLSKRIKGFLFERGCSEKI